KKVITESLDENFLSADKTKEKLNQIRIDRINSLQNQDQSKTKIPKRLLTLIENSIIREPSKADQKRNINGISDSQILNIINQYRKTLDNESLKRFSKLKIKAVSEIIKKSYNNSKNKKSLLDALYYT
ncbi:3030_t:CDS:1, partial [Scutellospora calospora]